MTRPDTTEQTGNLIPRPAVARSFGVTCRTVTRWEQLHGLTPFKITSRLVCYPASQIEKLKANARASAAEGGTNTSQTTKPAPVAA